MWETVILFWVRVPVLSEQMQEVEPRVSTDSRFLTNTILPAILWAVSASDTVTVARRPSGTLATMIPIMKTRFVMIPYPYANPKKKNVTPRKMATAEMILINLWISIESGVSADSAEDARLAI